MSKYKYNFIPPKGNGNEMVTVSTTAYLDDIAPFLFNFDLVERKVSNQILF